jgi:outer membrane protein OmpA-like peptidoglycan-associated protein
MAQFHSTVGFEPIYYCNGGKKACNIFNKKKAEREKEQIELLTLLDKTKKQLETILNQISNENKTANTDGGIKKAIEESNNKISEIELKTKETNIKNVDSYEKLLSLLKELRELKCTRIDAITKFLNKNTNKLYGDVSFRTGSAEISANGKKELKGLADKIESDIFEWRKYVNDCNERVFENDLYVLVVDIAGYADQQGSIADNILLSENRANAVKVELISNLNLLIKKGINIVFNKIDVVGYGEQLPPGVEQKGDDDPDRRICLITSLVGPSAILDKK